MPAPTVNIPVTDTSNGRRIFKEEAEAEFNDAFGALYDFMLNIPAGPRGEQGIQGIQGERWIVGPVRAYAVGLECVVGNAVYRTFSSSNITVLFRAIQNTTINANNFPTGAASTANWEAVIVAMAGPQGSQGIQGLQGVQGNSASVVEFATDAQAAAYSAANPLAIVVSTEGLL